MRRTLAVVLFGISTMFVSFSSFGVHLDKIFKDEAEAYASPSWTCQFNGVFPTFNPGGPNNAFSGIPVRGSLGSAMNVDACMNSARGKVIEMADAWRAEMNSFGLPGADPRCPAPVRELACYKGQKTQISDPVTGMPIDVYPYNCVGLYVSACVLYYQGYPTYAQGHQYGSLGPIAGHPYGEGWASYGGGIYILAPASSCSVSDIPPFGPPDPEPVDITAPNFKLGTQLACLQNAIRASNGTSTVNSGYRSAPYNKHLQQVWDKWQDFLDAQRPECAAELATAENHKNRHELVARPANSSDHTRGEAFDLSSGLYDGILDVLGFGCGLRRPDPIGDPPHFIRR